MGGFYIQATLARNKVEVIRLKKPPFCGSFPDKLASELLPHDVVQRMTIRSPDTLALAIN
jgi:hypothetical protein